MNNNFRTDFALDKHIKYTETKKYTKNNIKVFQNKLNKQIHHIILFNNIIDEQNIKSILKKEILHFLNLYNINRNNHIFIVGLGNESNTADSIGPKALKHINVNSHLFNLGIEINHTKISALEPGVLATTGIDTINIIKSVCKNIKPNLIILIDSFITNNINNLNKTIEITNTGIKPGSGIRGINSKITESNLEIPIITIGIPVCIEYKNDNNTLLVSTNDIDEYVYNISKIIGTSLNEILYQL